MRVKSRTRALHFLGKHSTTQLATNPSLSTFCYIFHFSSFFFETGSLYYIALAVLELSDQSNFELPERYSGFFCLLSAVIKGVYHQPQTYFTFQIKNKYMANEKLEIKSTKIGISCVCIHTCRWYGLKMGIFYWSPPFKTITYLKIIIYLCIYTYFCVCICRGQRIAYVSQFFPYTM